MKKLLTTAVMIGAIVLSSCKYADDDIWTSVRGSENRAAKLEELCKPMNTKGIAAIIISLYYSDAEYSGRGVSVKRILAFGESHYIPYAPI